VDGISTAERHHQLNQDEHSAGIWIKSVDISAALGAGDERRIGNERGRRRIQLNSDFIPGSGSEAVGEEETLLEIDFVILLFA
jgi:hypothetical protein